MNKLSYCSNCRENSIATKIYTRKDGVITRAMYCINKGCGNNQRLLLPSEIIKREKENIMTLQEKFIRYENVRVGGLTNMFAIRNVMELSGLTKEECLDIQDNYSEHKEKFNLQGSKMNKLKDILEAVALFGCKGKNCTDKDINRRVILQAQSDILDWMEKKFEEYMSK